MTNKNICQKLLDYNSVIKENDDLYRNAAKNFGLSDCTFWILYTLRESSGTITQSELCSVQCQPKQTVNSALKKLEADGLVELLHKENQRSKHIRLTQSGLALAQRTVDQVIAAEQRALSELPGKELEELLFLFRKLTDSLTSKFAYLDFPAD